MWKQTKGEDPPALEYDVKTFTHPTETIEIIDLLVRAGMVVRFYDPEEKVWMDQSKVKGVTRAPGNRDGQWGFPTSLELFEKEYLDTL